VVSAKVIYILRDYNAISVRMKRLACILLIVVVLLSGLILTQKVYSQYQSPGSITINSNTEWTVAQSPVNFNGTVTVNANATLTIDPGVTVNLYTYDFDIEGTLIAQGVANNQITFTTAFVNETAQTGSQNAPIGFGLPIYFAPGSTSWDAATDSGSIIQNAVLNGVSVNLEGTSAPEIDSCSFNYETPYQAPITIEDSSPQISNNIININDQGSVGGINGIDVYGGSPQIINNQFEGSFLSSVNVGSTSIGIDVTSESGTPVIRGNTFAAQYGNNTEGIKVTSGNPQITNNQFNGDRYLIGVDDSSSSAFTISNNVFTNCFMGIDAKAGTLTVQGNQFLNGTDGIDIIPGASLTISDNLIDSNSRYGINGGGTITSNTITNNQIGVHNPPAGVISENNIVGNTENSITATTANIDAQNNWWGIADTATINQTIYDSKVDPHLGTITFVPYLTQPSPSAPPIPSYTSTITPIPATQTQTNTQAQPTQAPQPTPSATPDQYSQTFAYQVGSLINLNLITVVVAIVLVLVWIIVILGYTAKSAISKYKPKK
jgi:hypothetical protein